jgi:TolB-like protein/class 3 adenylate cyclase
MTQTRRLAAILAADVAGYSRLIGADEEGTLAALRAIRRELGDPKIAEHRGRIVKTTGDGLLVEFQSVVDALRCAVDVQRGMAERNSQVAADRRIEFRIGIHQGDIVAEDDDILGDGVNVAARLEGLAEPGGICISARVQEDAAGRLDLAFQDLGEQSLKNIARPVRVYRVAVAAPTLPSAAGEGGLGRGPLPLPDKPSLAVLPFQNMTGDAEQDYFVDGVVEEITTAISRLPWLFVIARNSAFTYKGRAADVKQVARELGVRYVLEGSVRKAGNRVRITGQLIDTDSGAHIWADRFDGPMDDIFELQDQVASSVAGAIEPKLRQSEIERARRKPTNNLNAHDLYLRALAEFRKWTTEGWHGSIGLLRRALAIDPAYVPAAGLFAWCRVLQLTNGLISSEEIAEGARLARQAIEADKEDADALWMGGWGTFMLAGEHASGLNAIERSLALHPNCALAWAFCGWARGLANRPAPAIEALRQAMRLSPLDPQRWIFFGGLSLAHLVAGLHEEAVEWADRALRENPRMTAVANFKAAACGYLGRFEEGRECMKRLNEVLPGGVVANVRRSYETFVSPEVRAIFAEGRRKVGLPEQ